MESNLGTVLIAAPVHPVLTGGLAALGYSINVQEHITQQEAASLLSGCTGIIISTRLQLDKNLIDAAPQLKWIGRMGSGMEVIDVPYAREKGIDCFSSPEGNCNAVGEHAIGMLLNLVCRINVSNNEIKNNIWLRDENRGGELEGKTIGIIGFGHTGRSFAKKLQGFDMRILAYDKYAIGGVPRYVTACQSLEAIYREADIVSFHVPLQPDTKYYFNREFMVKMKKPFILINTSRGPVVELNALYEGLDNKLITGACLDVYETEPIVRMEPQMQQMVNKMIHYDNVIATPHIAGYTHEALYKMSRCLLEKISARKG